jgi:transcriptional regulator ATRX
VAALPAGDAQVFLISSKAGSVGINLVRARRLVIYDHPWNPVHNAQARACM